MSAGERRNILYGAQVVKFHVRATSASNRLALHRP
jgi:hypothetical protein